MGRLSMRPPSFVEEGRVAFKVLCTGRNYALCDPLGRTVHAEEDAMSRLSGRARKHPKRVHLLVIRTTKTGRLANSKPCSHCLRQMANMTTFRGYRIHRVHYSTGNGSEIASCTLTTLMQETTPHVSSFYRG